MSLFGLGVVGLALWFSCVNTIDLCCVYVWCVAGVVVCLWCFLRVVCGLGFVLVSCAALRWLD